jgi:hypothetical protein
MADSSETTNIDLEAYCTREIRRHEPPLDSPFLSGATTGALITFCIQLLLQYVPILYSSVSAGGAWSFDNGSLQLLFWTVVLGGLFGGVTHWLLSVTVGRLRVTFDAARLGFCAGGIAGAVFGASIVISRELSSSSTAIRMNWNIYSTEVTAYSLAFAAFGAVLSSVAFALWCRPRRLAGHTPDLTFVDDENHVIKAPQFDRLARVRDGNKIRLQFGVKRLMTLTALIAVLIGFPLFVYRQLMTIPALQLQGLAFAVTLVAVSLCVFPYGLWVVLRGPNVFARLASAIRAWQNLRRRKSNSELNDFDVID